MPYTLWTLWVAEFLCVYWPSDKTANESLDVSVCVQLLSATHWPANRYLMEQNGIDDDDGWGPAARKKNSSDFRNFKLFASFGLNVIVVGIIAIGDASIGRRRRCRPYKRKEFSIRTMSHPNEVENLFVATIIQSRQWLVHCCLFAHSPLAGWRV